MSKETLIAILALSHPIAMCVMFWFGREIGELRERDRAEDRRMTMADKIAMTWRVVAKSNVPFMDAYKSIEQVENAEEIRR